MRNDLSTLRVLFYLVCLGILYGSLFPFDFSLALEPDVLHHFIGSWNELPGRGDILGNIALFIPFGLIGALLVRRDTLGDYSLAWFCLTWVVVALGAQLLQLFLPSRDPAVFDLYTNGIGAAIGWWAAVMLSRHAVPVLPGGSLSRQMPLLLVAIWLAAMLVPFVPSVDLQSYKDALKPLLLAPHFVWHDCLMLASAWFVAFYLLQHYSGLRLSRLQLAAAMVVVLLLQVVIVTRSVSLTEVVAMALALSLWSLRAARELPANWVALGLLLAVLIDGLAPFVARPRAYAFGWIPFSGFLEGSMLSNTAALFRKTFQYGAIAWLVLRQPGPWPARVLPVAALLLLVELAQTRVWAGTPEITDPLLFLGIAWYIRRLPLAWVAAPARAPARADNAGSVAAVTPGVADEVPVRRMPVLAVVAIFAAVSALAVKLVLGLPGVPYNLLELFRFGANGIDLLFFGLMLLSLGIGGAWLGRVLATPNWALWRIPLALLLVCTVTYLLLWLSVTNESIRDIVGSTAFINRVMERGVLGDSGVALVQAIGRERAYGVALVLEPPLRFAALVAPFFVFMALCCVPFWRGRKPGDRAGVQALPVLATVLVLLALLYLAKVVAFDWSSTDNLNELIAPDGDWGLGGGGYLYALVGLICAVGALLAGVTRRSGISILHAFVAALVALPVSWFLLNNGLGQDVGKYGYHFSGVDFLLGPDRANLLSTQALFLRWSAVYTVAVAGIAFSVALCLRWYGVGGALLRQRRRRPMPVAAPTEAADVVSDKGSDKDSDKGSDNSLDLRLYREQSVFLQHQARSSGHSVSQVCNDMLAYFARETGASADSADTVRAYLRRSVDTPGQRFAPLPLRVELTTDARRTLHSLKPDARFSDSLAFRKLLEIFLEVAEQQGDETAP